MINSFIIGLGSALFGFCVAFLFWRRLVVTQQVKHRLQEENTRLMEKNTSLMGDVALLGKALKTKPDGIGTNSEIS